MESDQDVVSMLLYGDRVAGGIASAPGVEAGPEVIFQHFQCDTRLWTGISVINPNEGVVSAKLEAFAGSGAKLGELHERLD